MRQLKANAGLPHTRSQIDMNMVEGFFSKLTKQMLNGIRVSSKEELESRRYQYFDE